MDELYIIKVGGDILENEEKLKQFVSNVSQIKHRKIIIHGGGKLVDQLASKLGIEQQMIDGRRVTNSHTLDLTTMVYAGLINKKMVAALQANHNNAIGLTGADNNCIQATQRSEHPHNFGWVGDIVMEGVNTKFISSLVENQITPVFCSITHNNTGQLLNTNADTMASVIASAFSKTYHVSLIYCFEKKGVLENISDENSAIPLLAMAIYEELKAAQVISKGMLPKLENAFKAIHGGVENVIITHAEEILNIINLKKNVGTKITA